MNCEHIFEMMCLVADGEANLTERSIVEGHISSCEECLIVFASLQRTSTLLSTVEAVEPPAYLTSAILAKTIYAVSPWKQFVGQVSSLFKPVPIRAFAAAAGIIALAIVAYPRVEVALTITGPEVAIVTPGPASTNDMVPSNESNNNSEIVNPVKFGPKPVFENRPVNSNAFASIRRSKDMPLATTALLKTSVAIKSGAFVKKSITLPKSPIGKEMPAVKPDTTATDVEPSVVAPAPTVVATAPPMTPMEMATMLKDMEAGMKDNMVTMPEPAGGGHIVLTSNVSYDNSDQISTLADLKRSLRSTNLDAQRSIEKSIKAREIRLPVFRGSF
ncbi:MAG: hypothetical protein ABJA67_18355 [Chthonomonadales bacterium]